jgi:hypothetical protein
MTEPQNTPTPEQGSTVPKWVSEVEEILAHTDRDSTAIERARATATATRYRAPLRARVLLYKVRNRIGNGLWIGLFVLLVVLSWIVARQSPLVGRLLALATIVLIILVIARSLTRSRGRAGPSRKWRGRDLSDDFPGRSGRRGRKDDDDSPLGTPR